MSKRKRGNSSMAGCRRRLRWAGIAFVGLMCIFPVFLIIAPEGTFDTPTAEPTVTSTATTLPATATSTATDIPPTEFSKFTPTARPVAGAASICYETFEWARCDDFQPEPRNCVEAQQRSIPPDVAACCFPDRDRDKNGVACE